MGIHKDYPAAQAKAFEAAALSFTQAAAVMNGQAELLERTFVVLDVPKAIVDSVRSSGSTSPEDEDDAAPPGTR